MFRSKDSSPGVRLRQCHSVRPSETSIAALPDLFPEAEPSGAPVSPLQTPSPPEFRRSAHRSRLQWLPPFPCRYGRPVFPFSIVTPSTASFLKLQEVPTPQSTRIQDHPLRGDAAPFSASTRPTSSGAGAMRGDSWNPALRQNHSGTATGDRLCSQRWSCILSRPRCRTASSSFPNLSLRVGVVMFAFLSAYNRHIETTGRCDSDLQHLEQASGTALLLLADTGHRLL